MKMTRKSGGIFITITIIAIILFATVIIAKHHIKEQQISKNIMQKEKEREYMAQEAINLINTYMKIYTPERVYNAIYQYTKTQPNLTVRDVFYTNFLYGSLEHHKDLTDVLNITIDLNHRAGSPEKFILEDRVGDSVDYAFTSLALYDYAIKHYKEFGYEHTIPEEYASNYSVCMIYVKAKSNETKQTHYLMFTMIKTHKMFNNLPIIMTWDFETTYKYGNPHDFLWVINHFLKQKYNMTVDNYVYIEMRIINNNYRIIGRVNECKEEM